MCASCRNSEKCTSLNNTSGMCTHILSDVLYNYGLPVRYVLSGPSPCAIEYFLEKSWSLSKFRLCKIIYFCHSVFLMNSAKKIPQSGKCLVPGLVPCQVRRKKITVPRQVTISHRGSQVSKAVKQHFLNCAAFMSKASNSIKR